MWYWRTGTRAAAASARGTAAGARIMHDVEKTPNQTPRISKLTTFPPHNHTLATSWNQFYIFSHVLKNSIPHRLPTLSKFLFAFHPNTVPTNIGQLIARGKSSQNQNHSMICELGAQVLRAVLQRLRAHAAAAVAHQALTSLARRDAAGVLGCAPGAD